MKEIFTLKENVRVPHTDIILEKGERIKVHSKKNERVSFLQGNRSYKHVDDKGNLWQEIEKDGFTWFVNKIDTTHFQHLADIQGKGFEATMDSGRPAIWHVAQFKSGEDMDFYEELVKWLSGREEIAGKSFS